MAHELENVNGQYSFVSLREPAWHGLGKVLEAPISDLDWMKESGLAYAVEKVALYTSGMDVVPSHYAMVRSDTQKILGVVSKAYEPVQNQALMDWLRGLDGYANDVVIETAGVLGNGETVFISARCDGLKFDIGGDEHKGYMLLSNGHIGNRRLTVGPTGVRTVCKNTLGMATGHLRLDEKGGFALSGNLSSGFALRHTKNIADMMADIQQAYARTTECWKQTEEVMRAMAIKPLTEEAITTLFTKPFAQAKKVNKDAEALDALLDDAPNVAAAKAEEHDESVVATAMAKAREKRLREILASETCTRFTSTRDTLFAGLNACTEWITHELTVKAGDDDAKGTKRRFESNLLDRGDLLKRKCYKVAMELLTA